MIVFRDLKLLVVDIDGTLIPNVIDWDKLRMKVQELLGIDYELRPLATSLARLEIDDDLKDAAWSLIEREEIKSVDRIPLDEIAPSVEALKRSKALGFNIALVTLRSRRSAQSVVTKLGIRDLILSMVTRDDSYDRIEQLKLIVERYRPRCLVFIGDTTNDEAASIALGIPFIKVTNFRELPKAIEQAISICLGYLEISRHKIPSLSA